MFAKTIVLSDAFLDMPPTARCLYFTLNMLADDDGFVNAPRAIMRQTGATDDDMKILLAKKFVILFDSGVIVIKHWRINNYLRVDRHVDTKYSNEKEQLVSDNRGYHLIKADEVLPEEETEKKDKPEWRKRRESAYAESELPYSFDYLIKSAFRGKPCPICGYKMEDYAGAIHRPTIQHNLPISKGGKHELGNISVICHQCNVSLRNKEVGDANNAEVVEAWMKICEEHENDGIHSTVQDSTGKDSIDKDSTGTVQGDPSIEEIRQYAQEIQSKTDPDRFFTYYSGKWNTVRDWRALFRSWSKSDQERPAPQRKGNYFAPSMPSESAETYETGETDFTDEEGEELMAFLRGGTT